MFLTYRWHEQLQALEPLQDQLYRHGYCPREDCNRGHYLYHTEVLHMVYIKCCVDLRFYYKMRLNGNILSDKQCKE
jgi:hypothetical protein